MKKESTKDRFWRVAWFENLNRINQGNLITYIKTSRRLCASNMMSNNLSMVARTHGGKGNNRNSYCVGIRMCNKRA